MFIGEVNGLTFAAFIRILHCVNDSLDAVSSAMVRTTPTLSKDFSTSMIEVTPIATSYPRGYCLRQCKFLLFCRVCEPKTIPMIGNS